MRHFSPPNPADASLGDDWWQKCPGRSGSGSVVSPLWTAPLWIIELVEEEETCAGFVVTAEPVINARTTASWELESYLTWSRGFIYPKRMETSGRTRTLSNSVVRDRHYCSGLISTFSNKMILKHRQFIMLMLQIFHQQCWVFYVCSRFQLLGCVIRRVYNV